jgi:hypothetical protein
MSESQRMLLTRLYYTVRPFVPRRLQIILRRQAVLLKRFSTRSIWPIDERAAVPPEHWSGWPEGKQFALVLTHDVDTARGHERCRELMHMEDALGFRSSFNFVPERYAVSSALRLYLTDHGFEVGVHGLYHDGKLYDSREIFQSRAVRINEYLKEWNAVGFRSPSMQHNLEWILDLDIEYDASTFDTDPFEPQSDGVRTIFPFIVHGGREGRSYVELPYTLPQDFTLFVLMGEGNIDVWKRKLDWLVTHGGMALINTHPDYMNFSQGRPRTDEYSSKHYEDFLRHILRNYMELAWHVLPRDMARFWATDRT